MSVESMPAPFACRRCKARQVVLYVQGDRLWSICGNCGHRTLGRYEPVPEIAPGYDPRHGDHH